MPLELAALLGNRRGIALGALGVILGQQMNTTTEVTRIGRRKRLRVRHGKRNGSVGLPARVPARVPAPRHAIHTVAMDVVGYCRMLSDVVGNGG